MKRIILILLVITSLSTAAQESVLLRLNYTQGDNYVIDVESKQSMGMQGGMNMNMSMEMKITEVTAKRIKTESKITSVIMDMMQGGMTMSYDSNKKDEELDDMGKMMKSQFGPMLNATIHTTLDKKGNMTDTKIEPPIPGMDQITGNTSTIHYPEEKVSVGSSWTSEDENEGMKMNTTYTVSNIANGMVYLDLSGTVSGTGTGTIKGQTIVDIKSGIPTSATYEAEISAQGMDMSITNNTIITKT
ncbi:DUF6263 family protein [Christiangramia salexigens]|uniref:Lipocalin-like domain-containing protein n=1 Tax=Christiangramia salexigens TaxID=1913577 RepID=A0A1L3J428_9FLAO|nr:DUF6263 family protein [Christiangramia salexigens]APG59864.1 hypothetical protein LPB144_05295 [Christiangramia salexigens]